jgi:hypothetical protein
MRTVHSPVAAIVFTVAAFDWHPFGASRLTVLAVGLIVLALSPGRK